MTLWGVHQQWCGMYFHTRSVYASVEIAKTGHNHSARDWNKTITIYNWHIIKLGYYTVYNLLNHCFRKSRWFLERIKFTSDYHIQPDGLWSSPCEKWAAMFYNGRASTSVLKFVSSSWHIFLYLSTHFSLITSHMRKFRSG